MDYSGALISTVKLEWAEGFEAGPEEVLVKFVDPVHALEGVPEDKARRTIRSYQNEADFLSRCAVGLQESGCRVPTVHKVETEKQPFRLLIVMECMSNGFTQLPVLPKEASVAALCWLARFHAFGFSLQGDESGLWEVGGHTALPNRPKGEVERLPASFATMRANFEDAGPEFVLPAEDLGRRLASVAFKVDEWLSAALAYRTLSHGDYKAGNIFVKEETNEICVIDWQWTGWNITAHDVVYFFSTSASDDICCDDSFEFAFRLYHDAFVNALPEETRAKGSWNFQEHMRLFQLALLDYMRWAISYRLPSETPQKMAQRAAAVPVDANQGEYRRSPKRLSWLLAKVAAFLPAAESGALGVPVPA